MRSRTRRLCADVGDGPQQSERSTFTTSRVLTLREGDAPAVAATSLPDGKADQLQSVEFAAREMQFGVSQLARCLATIVDDLDNNVHGVTSEINVRCRWHQ